MNDRDKLHLWMCTNGFRPPDGADMDKLLRVLGEQRTAATERPRVADVVEAAADMWGISPERITGPSRDDVSVSARHAVAVVARQISGCSLSAIGWHLGGRDHSTIATAVKSVRARARKAADLREQLHELEWRALEIMELRHAGVCMDVRRERAHPRHLAPRTNQERAS